MKNHGHSHRKESTSLKQALKSAQEELQKAKKQIKGNESQIQDLELQVKTIDRNMKALLESAELDREEALITVEELRLDNEDLQINLAISSAKAEIIEKSALLLPRKEFLKCVSYLKNNDNVRQFSELLESGKGLTEVTKQLLALEPANNSVEDLEVEFVGATLLEE